MPQKPKRRSRAKNYITLSFNFFSFFLSFFLSFLLSAASCVASWSGFSLFRYSQFTKKKEGIIFLSFALLWLLVVVILVYCSLKYALSNINLHFFMEAKWKTKKIFSSNKKRTRLTRYINILYKRKDKKWKNLLR